MPSLPQLRVRTGYSFRHAYGRTPEIVERLNELEFYSADDPPHLRGFRTILATEPQHPFLEHWWPPGHVLGWDATFTHEIADLVTAIAAGTDPAPSFADGLQVQRVLAAHS